MLPAAVGALARAARCRNGAGAQQLQQLRHLNIHEYQVRRPLSLNEALAVLEAAVAAGASHLVHQFMIASVKRRVTCLPVLRCDYQRL